MTYYLRNANTFRVTDENSIDITTSLPADNYLVKADQFGNLFLETVDRFEPLTKYYGDTLRNADRIMRTFNDRSASTGVLLTGEKGSGKTLLAKHLSIMGYAAGMPTILINSSWTGDSFNKLIQDIQQPSIVMFDEFEKVWNERSPLEWDVTNPVPAAQAVVALLSDWFPKTTAEIIHVDGGLHAMGA